MTKHYVETTPRIFEAYKDGRLRHLLDSTPFEVGDKIGVTFGKLGTTPVDQLELEVTYVAERGPTTNEAIKLASVKLVDEKKGRPHGLNEKKLVEQLAAAKEAITRTETSRDETIRDWLNAEGQLNSMSRQMDTLGVPSRKDFKDRWRFVFDDLVELRRFHQDAPRITSEKLLTAIYKKLQTDFWGDLSADWFGPVGDDTINEELEHHAALHKLIEEVVAELQ